ncbi:MAG: hypothetical protein MT490_02560 [Sphingomonas sp.]|uniref:cobaltochelatase CobT-related protein n=1 Tax=Sphingomonas sp. TaxID=28214 RepID=UPI0022727D79|nr:hypothetical protein [Sphingomonas sp.]MCX8474657.1 hypothetical protein [Sphingomonas sp.]
MIDWRSLFKLPSGEVADGPADEPYRVFTRAYDLELPGAGITERLSTSNPDKLAWRDYDGTGWREARNLAEHLAEGQASIGDAISTALGSDAAEFAVTLLIDQSGSMKGAPIAAVANATRDFEACLSRAGARTEVLGFSTAGWHGGFAREAWLRGGRPERPGRLCALLHIVYKSADEPEWSPQSQQAMLHPDLLRENVDGEALDWAVERLSSAPARYKLLIMLSDGAPVDDSTLKENGPSYLEWHLCRSIARIEGGNEVTLGALGIGYEVGRYYRHSRAGGDRYSSRGSNEAVREPRGDCPPVHRFEVSYRNYPGG